MMNKSYFLIGIDAGVNTGFAKIVNGVLHEVKTYTIIEAMKSIEFTIQYCQKNNIYLKIYIEDARKRKWIPSNVGREVLQGVGSVKRDCGIWEEFCIYHDVDFELVPPKANKTKLTSVQFKKITGWQHRTSEHARDATMLIFNRKVNL